jgi:hypothetical protein
MGFVEPGKSDDAVLDDFGFVPQRHGGLLVLTVECPTSLASCGFAPRHFDGRREAAARVIASIQVGMASTSPA